MERNSAPLPNPNKSDTEVGHELDLPPPMPAAEFGLRAHRSIRQLGRRVFVAEYTRVAISQADHPQTLKLVTRETTETLSNRRSDRKKRKAQVEAILEKVAKTERAEGFKRELKSARTTKAQQRLVKKFYVYGPDAFTTIPSGEARPIEILTNSALNKDSGDVG